MAEALAQLSNSRSPILLFLAILIIAFPLRYWVTRNKQRKHFPPGPKPKFLVGNLFDFPITDSAASYVEWEKKYKSKILHASCLGKHFFVLNSLKDAEELLEKRANIYSDRPDYTVTHETNWADNMAFMRQNELWRKNRRLAQQNLRQDAVSTYHPTQLSQTHKMLRGLLDSPERFAIHNKKLSLGIAMSTMYGYDLEDDDPYIVHTEEAASMAFRLMQPGYTLVNFLPFLKHIPGWFPKATSQREIRYTRQLTDMLMVTPIEAVKKQLNDGRAVPCMVSQVLEQGNVSKEDEKVLTGLSFTIYTGASDTTISATSTFFYLMVTHPEIQAKAQEEIDRVIGPDRLPTFDDRPSLPYIDAIYREVLRWRPPTLMGLPHRVIRDDTYNGYFIPEGTTVFANIWAMTRDESLYPDAMVFKPERYLNSSGELTDDDRVLTFGFGRRICVGKHVASATLWITFTSILATFNMTPAKDENGKPIAVEDGFDDPSIIVHKKPFKCSILPRSLGARKLVEESLAHENLLSSI